MEDCSEASGVVDNPKLGSTTARVFESNRWTENSFKVCRLWVSLDCVPDCLLATTPKWSPESWPLEWGQKRGAVNMVRSCKEGVAVKQSRSRSEGCCSKFGTSKDFFLPNLF